jgi:hypothetical protein
VDAALLGAGSDKVLRVRLIARRDHPRTQFCHHSILASNLWNS